MFAVVRHPDVEALGVIPDAALASHRANGWFRVSPWREQPSDLHLPDYAEATEDLDAEPEPASKPAKTTKENKA